MAGKNVSDFTFKKKDTVVTMDSKSCAKIDGQSLPVNPQLLFQRLLTVVRQTSENLTDIFKYELCNRPPALFDPSGLPREANKPALADAIWSVGKGVDMPAAPPPTQEMKYVLDGGSLLYRLPSPRGKTFDSIPPCMWTMSRGFHSVPLCLMAMRQVHPQRTLHTFGDLVVLWAPR